MNTDVVICNFPPMLKYYLPAGPAVLLGACQWLGLKSEYIDFNTEKTIDIDIWAKQVVNQTPKIVALSIFSYKSKQYALDLSKKIKEKNSCIQIVIGGAGTKDALNGDIHPEFKYYLDRGIIDRCILGDGEYAFPELLTQIFNLPKIAKFDFSTLPYLGDYSKHNLSYYGQEASVNNKKLIVPITGSRGCIRNCTYCDVPARWKFMQKDSELIANEIESILSNLPFTAIHIHFTDSLVNGNLHTFDRLLDRLIDIKLKYPNFTWGGQFIIRRAKQSTDEYWKRIGKSGAYNLEIGIETGSDRLRAKMKKHFSNDDLRHSLKLMEKYNVTCIFLMFTGSPDETIDDFDESLSLLTEFSKYSSKVITEIQLGYLTTINPETPLLEKSKNDTSMILTKNPIVWYNKNNPTLTFAERIRRRENFESHAQNCGYKLSWDTHIQIEEAYQSYHENISIIKLIEKQK